MHKAVSKYLTRQQLRLTAVFLTFTYFFTFIASPVLANISYSYDKNGNMTSDGTQCYTYNDENQMVKTANCSTGKLINQNTYDDQGNRIKQLVYDTNGNLVKTIYTPTKDYELTILASNSAKLSTTYYHANGEVVARKNPDNTKTFYLADNLGSTTALVDESQKTIEKTTYSPYGTVLSGGTQSKHLYTGQIADSQSGLDYYNARYYNPHIMHFTQPDTQINNVYDPQQLNRYSYVGNNPMSKNDPSGHGPEIAAFFIPGLQEIAAIGALAWGVYYLATHPQIITNASHVIASLFNKPTTPTTQNKTPSNNQPTNPGNPNSGNPNPQSPKIPNLNPDDLNKIARTIPLIPENKKENIFSGFATINQALNTAETWLGEKYTEVGPGVYRSADKLRQFRMNTLTGSLPHVNFELFDEVGKRLENGHVYLLDMLK